jgi:hypothetical protein
VAGRKPRPLQGGTSGVNEHYAAFFFAKKSPMRSSALTIFSVELA